MISIRAVVEAKINERMRTSDYYTWNQDRHPEDPTPAKKGTWLVLVELYGPMM